MNSKIKFANRAIDHRKRNTLHINITIIIPVTGTHYFTLYRYKIFIFML